MKLRAAMFPMAGVLSMALALSLSGCSTSSGPSKGDIIKALAQQSAGEQGDWKGDYTKDKDVFEKLRPYLRVQKCEKTGVATWTCNLYFVGRKDGRPYSDQSIELHHEGSKWMYVPGTDHRYYSSVGGS